MAVKIQGSSNALFILHSYKCKSFSQFNPIDLTTVLEKALNVLLLKVVRYVTYVNSELNIPTQFGFDILKIRIRKLINFTYFLLKLPLPVMQ